MPKETRAVLQACPEIGPARARALVASLGSVKDVALASPERLTQIPGIGPLTAARLIDALTTCGTESRESDPPETAGDPPQRNTSRS